MFMSCALGAGCRNQYVNRGQNQLTMYMSTISVSLRPMSLFYRCFACVCVCILLYCWCATVYVMIYLWIANPCFSSVFLCFFQIGWRSHVMSSYVSEGGRNTTLSRKNRYGMILFGTESRWQVCYFFWHSALGRLRIVMFLIRFTTLMFVNIVSVL